MMITLGRSAPALVQLTLLFVTTLPVPTLEAQLLSRSTVIQNARIVTMTGTTIEKGTIIIKDDRIARLGRDPAVPFLSRRIDAEGGTVTPGLIDVHSSLGMTSGRARTGAPTARAEDAFDRYAREHLREALRSGVTTVYVSSRGAVGIHGTGAVIRLVPRKDGSIGETLAAGGVLEIDIGSSQSPLARIARFDAIRKQFRDALDYRRDREVYEEDLAEYEKKLKERAAKKKTTEKSEGGKKNEEGSGDKAPRGGRRTAEPPPRPAAEAKPAEPAKPAEEELKKPTEPKKDRRKEALLRALDRELRVRIEAYRSEDILNALDLKEEFSLDLILEGATDAYLVADQLARADVPVVLGDQLWTEVPTDGPFRRRNARSPAILSRAGVSWWVGSGARSATAARFVLPNAQIASAGSEVENPGVYALALLTSRAARFLGVADEIGRLAPNLKADLVVWSGDPLDPGTTVRKVFVGGELAYDAEVRP